MHPHPHHHHHHHQQQLKHSSQLRHFGAKLTSLNVHTIYCDFDQRALPHKQRDGKFSVCKMRSSVDLLLLLTYSAACLRLAASLENGLARTPPMGWRSWNLYGDDVSQEMMKSQMDGLTKRNRIIGGKPTSLADLGYRDVGLDDAWQMCGSYGPNEYTFHDVHGKPMVNLTRFPDLKTLTDYGHDLNLTVGWYGNNCICEDHCVTHSCYEEDVSALLEFGFDSYKIDGCGKQLDLQKYSDLIADRGAKILIENCHWGYTIPSYTEDGELDCPYNYYRSSQDIRSSYASVMNNLLTIDPLSKANLSVPGCWAYPDMLEMGVKNIVAPDGSVGSDVGLSFYEARTHFGAWCITSSPLILSHDLNDEKLEDNIWEIIANNEAISVNQAYMGDSGSMFLASHKIVNMKGFSDNGVMGSPVIVHSRQQWSKKLKDNVAGTLNFLSCLGSMRVASIYTYSSFA